MVKNDEPLLRRKLLQIGGLHRAADVYTHGLIVIEEASQVQAGTANVVYCDVDFLKIRGFIKKVKLELRNEL